MTKIIADFCCNHLGDRRLMEEGIKQLAEIGVDCVKFQSFQAEKLNKSWPDYENAKAYYKSVELSQDDHLFILGKCSKYGIKPLFTVFDVDSAKLIHNIGCKFIKIASPDADNFDLIQICDSLFDKLLISCGMISSRNLSVLRITYPKHDLLYCVSKYPTVYSDIDFNKMLEFDGFSDHTQTLQASKKAIEFNMEYIERHFTLGKFLPGKDHKFSSTPDEFKELVDHKNYVDSIPKYKSRWRSE
jgi:N,N'-diacetyllegionaminate synthase